MSQPHSLSTKLDEKIVLLGAHNVGKTSLITRYVHNVFKELDVTTLGYSHFKCSLRLDGYHVTLQVWDTAGQEMYRAMAPMYYRKASAALLVYDITSASSFANLKSWYQELKQNVGRSMIIIIVGNKLDLESKRSVSLEEVTEYSTNIGARYFETSARNNKGIEDVFVHVARSLVQLHGEVAENNQLMNSFVVPSGSVNVNLLDNANSDKTKTANNCC